MPKRKKSTPVTTKQALERAEVKGWETYEDYLKSDKWKQVKDDFYKNYQGWVNVCEITGESFEGEERKDLHFHHFKYPSDWANDSWQNLIHISKEVHDFIFKATADGFFEPEKKDLDNREKFKTYLLGKWQEHVIEEGEREGIDEWHKRTKIEATCVNLGKVLKRYSLLIDYQTEEIERLKKEIKK